MQLKPIKVILVVFCVMLFSCASKEKKTESRNKTDKQSEVKKPEDILTIKKEDAFQQTQDSLRILLLESKPNANLKSSVLEELYIRGFVDQVGNNIKFNLPFNVHTIDCGAPDCFTTDISFEILATDPIVFPETVDVRLREYGCDIKVKVDTIVDFKLMQHSPTYINYYSETHRSNLVILGPERKLYYFEDVGPSIIKVALLDDILKDYDDDDPNAIVPFQSFLMTINEYEKFVGTATKFPNTVKK